MQTTTGKSPAKINKFNCSPCNFTYSDSYTFFSNKGRRFPIAAFLLLITAFLSSACETPGSVGNDIVQDDEDIASETILLEDYSIIEENSFSGRLTYSSVGAYDDPVFGNIHSTALLKPAISSPEIDTILDGETVTLRVIFSNTIYGDSLAQSDFEIFEIAEIWRGAELRYNEEIPVDMGNKIAEFSVSAEQDTAVVELSQPWVDEYISYFNSDPDLTAAQNDSLYIRNFPGLAIVPAAGNRNIRYLKNRVTTDDTEEVVTSFLLNAAPGDDEESDTTSARILNVRDWGASLTREPGEATYGNFFLHNTERILRLQPDIPEDLGSKNIINASLILSNRDPLEDSGSLARQNTNIIRAHVFDEQPFDVMSEIFTTPPSFSSAIDDTSNAFLMNITPYMLDNVYGDAEDQQIYITIESVNGLLFSNYFYDPESDEIRKPRIVITYVEE